MAGTDFSHLTNDELINGIQALKLPDYIRSKAYGVDVRETLAQMTEMTIQLGVNMGLSPEDALKWSRKLQESVSQSEFDSWVATLLDGGPSIFMNTLSELQTTYPNGAAGVALVRETDPAKIYVWNGTSWEDFGDYQGIEVKDGTITPVKTTFFNQKRINLFDKSKITTPGIVYSLNGTIIANTELSKSYGVSEPIPVIGGEFYELTPSFASAWYGNDGVFISSFDLNGKKGRMQAPTKAKTLRTTFDLSALNSAMISLGTLPEIYVPYEYFVLSFRETWQKETLSKQIYEEIRIPIRNQISEVIKAPLSKDKVGVFIGDSITEKNFRTNKNYQDYIAERTGMTAINLGISGTGWHDRVDMANEITVTPDFISVFLGTNTWGEVNNSLPLGDFGDTGMSTVCGYIYNGMNNLVNKFPTTPIGIITPLPRANNWGSNATANSLGYTLEQLSEKIIQHANHFSLPYLDLYHESTLPVWTTAGNSHYFKALSLSEPDGLHPNDNGHLNISYTVQPWLESKLIRG